MGPWQKRSCKQVRRHNKRSVILGRVLLKAVWLGLAVSGSAWADEVAEARAPQQAAGAMPCVLILGDDAEELRSQLRVELMAMGFTVSSVKQEGQSEVIELRLLGVNEVELGLVHGSRLKMERPAELPARLFAMRVAEQVRASLLVSEVDESRSDTETFRAPEEAKPSLEAPAPAEDERAPKNETYESRVNLLLSAGAEWGPGGLGAAFRFGARVEVWPFEHWGLAGFALLPTQSQNLDLASTRVETTILSMGGGPAARFWLAPQLSMHSSLGAGGAIVSMQGKAAAPLQGTRDTVLPALIYASLASEYFISSTWYVEASALGMYYLPTISVNLPDGVAAERPYALAGQFGLGAAF